MHQYTDGNYNPLDDVIEDAASDFVLDREGNEVRAGDFVQMPDTHSFYPGKVVRVERATRGVVYAKYTGVVKDAWSPSSRSNMLSVKFHRSSTSCKAVEALRVDLTPEAHKEYRLAELNAEIADVSSAIRNLSLRQAALFTEVAKVIES